MKIKILYFVDRLLQGGIQSFLLTFCEKIDKTKFDVDILVLDDGKEYCQEESLFEKLGIKILKLNGVWLNSIFDYAYYQKALNNFFSKHHYDIVHIHSGPKNYLIAKIAKRYGISVRIYHSHNIGYQTKSIIKKIYGNLLKIKVKKYCTDYFACSLPAGQWMFGKNKKFEIIHNAIDVEKYRFDSIIRLEMRKLLGISQKFVIGNVGRFCNQKNHSYLVDVFFELQKKKPDAVLLLIGKGILMEQIKQKVEAFGISDKVIFVGEQRDVFKYYQAMDCFVMPSLYEGLGIVAVEAQASGLPCLLSDSIPNEVKINENVSFLSLANKTAWVEQLIAFSEMSSRRELVFDNVNSSFYNIENEVKRLEDLYLKRLDRNII